MSCVLLMLAGHCKPDGSEQADVESTSSGQSDSSGDQATESGGESTESDGESTTHAETDETETDGGVEPMPEPCPNPLEPDTCPPPHDHGDFSATINFVTPGASYPQYDGLCVVADASIDGPTFIELDCELGNPYSTPRTIEISTEPAWAPPAIGTELRMRVDYRDYDGQKNIWHSWRLERADSGVLVAGMIWDVSGGSASDYDEWTLPTAVIWDGCTEDCANWHGIWLRMSLDAESVAMFGGDICDLGDFRIWLQEASGAGCDDNDIGLVYATRLLVLNTNV